MIFNDIWQADMKGNGLIPLIKGLSDNEKNEETGYVIVNTNPFPEGRSSNSSDGQVNVLETVVIPESKLTTYELFKKLHDNYDWRRKKNDPTPQEEIKEVDEFLNFVIETQPMKLARDYVSENGKIESGASDEEWKDLLKTIWFKQFDNNSTSAFEHVFIGEEGGKKRRGKSDLGGHHSWYHYYINDGPYEKTHQDDVILFLKAVQVNSRAEKSNKAEVITIRYEYTAKDNEGSKTLLKETGGFFVGLSPEGLLAMGTVGFLHESGEENIPIVINEENYVLTVWRTQDNEKNPRTFFPRIPKENG
ncbi:MULTISPECIES: hypothetical protein [Lysinibacillus]|uniref:hypothetical protein n=1 Tax=Lysinibacillus TaxID=400634 RepID=UPI001C2F54D8|nr:MULTISPECIES: hypothetical protein [Lysinibacillus]